MRNLSNLIGLAMFLVMACVGQASATVAYQNLVGQPGIQPFGGSVGMDFSVNTPIEVTRLGVFDSGADGLGLTLNARIFDLDTTLPVSPVVTFTPGDPGVLEDSSRFKTLGTPLSLVPGNYTMVAWGYGAGELLGNEGGGSPTAAFKATDDGGGLLSFIGVGRFNATGGNFPNTPDGGPANRYSAGTFDFTFTPVPVSDNIPLINGSFETTRSNGAPFALGEGQFIHDTNNGNTGLPNTDLPGWDGGGGVGVFNPGPGETLHAQTDGQNLLFINVGTTRQSVTHFYEAGASYLFEGVVASRGSQATYEIELLAGTTSLGLITHADVPALVQNFSPFSIEVDQGLALLANGEQLNIRITKLGGGQLVVDNLRLSGVRIVPEPATGLLLLLSGTAVALRRRRSANK